MNDLIKCWKRKGLNIFMILSRILKIRLEKITRIHSHWEEDKYMYVGYSWKPETLKKCYWCSVCNYGTDESALFDYCPQCGARMDEEVQND